MYLFILFLSVKTILHGVLASDFIKDTGMGLNFSVLSKKNLSGDSKTAQ